MNFPPKDMVLAVVGLGYVGLPLAVAFGRVCDKSVIGFDVCAAKVGNFRRGYDVTKEVGHETLKTANVFFTDNEADIATANFIIIAVPTPVDDHNSPDLSSLENASTLVGRNLKKGAVVVYESTVYPGVTEEVCQPLLEKASGLRCGIDFKIGYSPERINPGDSVHRIDSITKIVSGMDEETLNVVADVYSTIVKAGVYKASSIKVAEAAKVIENSQRDINIAFVNELAMIFHKMGIDTMEVLRAAGTKWNFLNFRPGLVGGHCIGVDPYYLTYKAQALGYHPEIILAGRRINDNMGNFIVTQTLKELIKDQCPVKGAKVLVMGITFKEDVPDVRNSKIADIVRELMDYGIEVYVIDPHAESYSVKQEYGFALSDSPPMVDAVILAVAHKEYVCLNLHEIKAKLAPSRSIFIDVKGIFDCQSAEDAGLKYWRL